MTSVAGDAYISVFINSGANLVSKLFEVPKNVSEGEKCAFCMFKSGLV
jgi:hypothetical protein